MKKNLACLFVSLVCSICFVSAKTPSKPVLKLFTANNKYFQYTGRVDFSNPLKPRFWSSGVYVRMKFKGKGCEIIVNDQMKYGNSHNYIDITVDGQTPYRVQTTDVTDNIKVGGDLENKEHTVTICKDTEAGIGYLEFVGVKCEKLLKLPAKPKHRIEFVGTTITCGADMDRSVYPCNFGDWYVHHNANMSYGAVTARSLNADFQITAISGIGLTNSCCNIPIMPKAFDKINTAADSLIWNFSIYQPDVLSICLGESDGPAALDSAKFCGAFVDFIGNIRHFYPKTTIVCLNIPTGDLRLNKALKSFMVGISDYMNAHGDSKVYPFSITKTYTSGCNNHPDMGDHALIAAELSEYIKKIMKWK
ncbi:SGNH/GDSL hydrolase family protein [Mucilaginibacter gracilis]|nr:SGNH/GDSL hydrolase family protein [Mucilaginibacter gracilis]